MTITVIQAGGESDDAAASTSRAFASNVTAGSLIVVAVWRWVQAAVDPFVTGDCTRTGTADLTPFNLDVARLGVHTSNEGVGIWSAIVQTGGSLTVTVAGNAGDYWGIALMEFGGRWGVGRNIGWNSADNSANASADSGNVATPGPGLIVGVFNSDANSVTITEDAAFTVAYESQSASSQNGSAIYRLVNSATTDSASWSLSANGWTAAAAAYREEEYRSFHGLLRRSRYPI